MPSLLHILSQPTLDAIFPFSSVPLKLRLLLLAFQPLTFLTYAIVGLPYQLSRKPYKILQVPLPKSRGGGNIRCMVFQPPVVSQSALKPLHISIHGGAFIGGFAENMASFCEMLSEKTGCVAISISYRFAPAYSFPTAHDDVRGVVRWICHRAGEMWGADGTRITVSGSSAGANLALDLAMGAVERERLKLPVIEGYVGICAPVELRIPPWEKKWERPVPTSYPKRDPLAFLLPLFHAYGASALIIDPFSKRANPCLRHQLSDMSSLPKNMLFVVAGVDILLKEQLDYVQALQSTKTLGERERMRLPHVECEVYEDGFHGWFELPDYLLRNPKLTGAKHRAVAKAIGFLENIVMQSREQAL